MRESNNSSGPVPGLSNARLVNAITNVLGNQQPGGLEGLVDRFVKEGLGEVINSWISAEENLPVSVTQIQKVLGREMINEIAWQAQISKKEAAFQIALTLPQMVDKLTPTGRISPGVKLGPGLPFVEFSMAS